jgi:formylglycine-generating enzyme required for sulfatase activity
LALFGPFALGLPGEGRKGQELTYVAENTRGASEYWCERDSSIMILVPAGEFVMGSREGGGSADEHPSHKVYLDSFLIDEYEVTNAQYKRFCDATEHPYPPDLRIGGDSISFSNFPDHPVVRVSWDDAMAYATWTGKRLPTEAEWEKAARGTDGRKYPWGNEEPGEERILRCNYLESRDGYDGTAPVGEFEAGVSPYGVHDLAGNVAEWCYDWYSAEYYSQSPSSNPQGPADGVHRVDRGGGWRSPLTDVRCAYRHGSLPSRKTEAYGFRCARSWP